MIGTFVRPVVFLFVLSAVAMGCSEDESPAEVAESGSCNTVAADAECFEFTGDADILAEEQGLCAEDGGTWSSDPCPTTALMGCCEVDVGSDEYRDCYYAGHLDSATVHEQSCADSYGEWQPGGSGGLIESGSCNGIATVSECYEVEGDPAVVADEREFCQEVGDTWTSEPCPTADLIGCCYYEVASDEFRDCYYVGHPDPATVLEQYCVEFDGEWRPGSR